MTRTLRESEDILEALIARMSEVTPPCYRHYSSLCREAVAKELDNAHLKYLAHVLATEMEAPTSVFMDVIKDEQNRNKNGEVLSTTRKAAASIVGEMREMYWKIVTWNGAFFVCEKEDDPDAVCPGVFREISDADLKEVIREAFEGKPIARTKGQLEELVSLVKHMTNEPDFFDDAPRGATLENGRLRFDEESGSAVLEARSASQKSRHLLDFTYDPAARAPLFERFLGRVFPDASTRWAYLEMLAVIVFGLRPSGDPHRRIVIVHGPPGSGKSTLLEVVRMLATPQLTVTVPLTELDKATSRARLRGKVLNISQELPSDLSPRKRNELVEQIKKFAAGERMTGRFLYENEFEFDAVALHWFATNRLLCLGGEIEALGRRMLLLAAENPLAQSEMSAGFLDEVRAERPGILNLCVEAARRLMSAGSFSVPAGQEEALEQICFGDDLPARFMRRYARPNAGSKVKNYELWAAFRGFAKEQGEEVGATINSATMVKLSGWVTAMGGRRGRSGNPPTYTGVEIAWRPCANASSGGEEESNGSSREVDIEDL